MSEMTLALSSGFEVFGLNINFYGIISALSYLLGIVITCINAKKRGFKVDDIITLACYVIPMAIIGARIYYVCFRLDHYKTLWDVIKIWEGGLAFYGGLIGGAVAVGAYCLIHKKNFLALIDIIAPALIISQSLGRWGNFFNQEAFGYEVTNPNWQWFPFAVYIEDLNQWHLATFFYESLWNAISFVVLMFLLYKKDFKQKGLIGAFYLIFYGLGRVVIEGLRTDSLYIGPLRVSQVLSGLFIVFGVVYVIYCALSKPKKKDSFDIIMGVLKSDL